MPLPPPRRNLLLFWCHHCRRPVAIPPSLAAPSILLCPRCLGPFVQHLEIPFPSLPPPPPPPPPHFLFPYLHGDYYTGPNLSELIQELTESDRTGPPPASSYSIDTLPTVAITAAHLRGCSECPVCKEEFFVGEEAREMPCQHVYHSDCIVPWLRLHNSCPVCRCRLPGEEPAAGRESSGRAEGRGGNRRRRRREVESWNPFTMLSAFRGSLSPPRWDRRHGVDRPELQDSDPLESPAGMADCSIIYNVTAIIQYRRSNTTRQKNKAL